MTSQSPASELDATRADGRTFHQVTAEFVQFATPGDTWEGVLLNKGTVIVGNPPKEVGKYTLRPDGEGPIAFLGGQMLDDAFALISEGDYVRVTYLKKEERKGGHTLKHFTVEVADAEEPF